MDFSVQYEEINSSVVKIIAYQSTFYYKKLIISNGSGVLIDNGRKVITCSHCVNIPNTQLLIKTTNNAEHLGKIIFNDPNIDIAIIELHTPCPNGVVIGNPNDLKIGQEVFLVGFPSHTSSISAMGANISGMERGKIFIDASVNHGNSGGPLFNNKGELIGIVNSKMGNLSSFLNQIKDLKIPTAIQIGNLDPIQIIQQLITEMKANLNLGMGTAIKFDIINNSSDIIKELM
ncbi:S1 family peptidase [Chryseobacterium indologenes]|uniref:S1 family peptidase n=1 Tax=Chryseobacterium indologenes TaxID=253 RepID=UPI00162AE9BC|nr:serine protease [Chryseobacterium indologenes]